MDSDIGTPKSSGSFFNGYGAGSRRSISKANYSGQSNVNHVNLSQLKQRVLELEQYSNILLTEKEQFLQEVKSNMYIHNLSVSPIITINNSPMKLIPFQISKLEENNADLTHNNDLLQMQLNEAESRTRVLSATFNATNSEMDKEFQLNDHLEQRVKSQQVMIAKLRKEQKQMTSTNQSLAKQLEETNAKYDKLQNEYDLVTKDDTQYINELEYEIDELQKRITAQNQRALPPLEQTSDTLPDAEDQKTEDIPEGGGGVGAHFLQRTQILPSLPSFSHRSSRSMSFRSITSDRSRYSPAFNKISSPRRRLLGSNSILKPGKQTFQLPPIRMSANRSRLRSDAASSAAPSVVQSDTVDGDNFGDLQFVRARAGSEVDSVVYFEDRYSVRSGSVISEPVDDDELYDDELKEQYDALMEYNDALKKKHQETLDEFEVIKSEKDTVKELHLEKVKEVKRLREQLKQKDEMVQSKIREIGEVKERLKKLKRKNAEERDHERAQRMEYGDKEKEEMEDRHRVEMEQQQEEMERMQIEYEQLEQELEDQRTELEQLRHENQEMAMVITAPPERESAAGCYLMGWFGKE